MSGIASVGLLFWATFCPPSVDQGKTVLLAISAVCFVVGSYHVWSKEHQLVLNLTEKTQIEALDDLLSDFEKLVNWYASDAKTKPKPLNLLIERARRELRRHAPNYVHTFNDVVRDGAHAQRAEPMPVFGTEEEAEKWLKANPERYLCWQIASACHYQLKFVLVACDAKLP